MVSETPTESNRALSRFFWLTFALSWGVGALVLGASYIIPSRYASLAFDGWVFSFITCAPSISAIIVAFWMQGPDGLKTLFGSLFKPFHWIWLFISVLVIPFVIVSLAIGHELLGAEWPVSVQVATNAWPLALLTTPLLLQNIAPFGEELGWRGFALPRLLQGQSVLVASAVLGTIWTIWHVPAFLLSGTSVTSLAGFVSWALGTYALTLIMTVLFVRSNGNVIVAGVIPHMIINSGPALGIWNSRPSESVLLTVVAATMYIVAVRRTS